MTPFWNMPAPSREVTAVGAGGGGSGGGNDAITINNLPDALTVNNLHWIADAQIARGNLPHDVAPMADHCRACGMTGLQMRQAGAANCPGSAAQRAANEAEKANAALRDAAESAKRAEHRADVFRDLWAACQQPAEQRDASLSAALRKAAQEHQERHDRRNKAAAAAIVALINSKPSSPTEDEIVEIIERTSA